MNNLNKIVNNTDDTLDPDLITEFIDTKECFCIVPVKVYLNTEIDKPSIIKDNEGKVGIYM